MRSASTNGLSCRCSRELAGYRGVLPRRICQISLSLSLTGVLARSTEYVVLAGAPKPWAGSQLACVSRAHWGTPQPFVAVTARVGMWTRAGRNSPAPCRVYLRCVCGLLVGATRTSRMRRQPSPCAQLGRIWQLQMPKGISIAIRVSRQRKSCGLDKAL